MESRPTFVDDSDEPTASTRLVLHDLELQLRRRADQQVVNALRIGSLSLAGYQPGEIRKRLELSVDEFAGASKWLREAIMQSRSR